VILFGIQADLASILSGLAFAALMVLELLGRIVSIVSGPHGHEDSSAQRESMGFWACTFSIVLALAIFGKMVLGIRADSAGNLPELVLKLWQLAAVAGGLNGFLVRYDWEFNYFAPLGTRLPGESSDVSRRRS